MKRGGLMGELIAETFGTFILVLLGDGVVANVGLAPRLASNGYDWNTITIGWGFAVLVAVYISGGVTGAHINPAVTLAMAVKRGFPWGKVAPYMVAQVFGAFLGAAAVFLIYRDGLVSAGMPNVWSTGPGSAFTEAYWGAAGSSGGTPYSMLTTGIAELFGTMVLIWGILGITDDKNIGKAGFLGPLLIGFVVLSIGLSLGGPSGYAINPARDFGPRVFGAIVGTKGLFSDMYWLVVPIIAVLIGGAIAPFFYDWFVGAFLPNGEEEAA